MKIRLLIFKLTKEYTMATIVMSADKVINAAKWVIEEIKDYQVRRDEETIMNVITTKKVFNWKQFKFITRTREEAIKYLNESNMFGWRCMRGWGDFKHAEKLLKLAKHGDPVTLNEEDTRVLF